MPMTSYREGLLSRLMDSEYAALYLKTALDELIEDSDWNAFLLALSNVREARERAGMNVPALEALKQTAKGTDLASLSRLLDQLGIAIELKPVDIPVVM